MINFSIVNIVIIFLLNTVSQTLQQEPYFYLYTKSNPNHYDILSLNDKNSFDYLNRTKDYVFIIHGYKTNVNKTSWQSLKDTILKKVIFFLSFRFIYN